MIVLPSVTLTSTAGSIDWSAYPNTAEVRLANHSAFVLLVTIGGANYALDPFTADRFPAPDSRHLTYVPSTSISPATTGTLLVTIADKLGESIPGFYPLHLR